MNLIEIKSFAQALKKLVGLKFLMLLSAKVVEQKFISKIAELLDKLLLIESA